MKKKQKPLRSGEGHAGLRPGEAHFHCPLISSLTQPAPPPPAMLGLGQKERGEDLYKVPCQRCGPRGGAPPPQAQLQLGRVHARGRAARPRAGEHRGGGHASRMPAPAGQEPQPGRRAHPVPEVRRPGRWRGPPLGALPHQALPRQRARRLRREGRSQRERRVQQCARACLRRAHAPLHVPQERPRPVHDRHHPPLGRAPRQARGRGR